MSTPGTTIPGGMGDTTTTTTVRPSIGNYKGVMLCNRPFAGVTAASHPNASNPSSSSSSGNPDRGSFICGTVAKPWGSNVPVTEKSRVLSKNLVKKDGALSRHKKWLSDLKREKFNKERERRERESEKEDKKRRFMEREARKRVTSWVVVEEGEGCGGVTRNGTTENTPPSLKNGDDLSSLPPPPPEQQQQRRRPKENVKSSKSNNKPAWAMTETQSSQHAEEDLLAFAADLDFDDFTDDLELRVLMTQVKDRIDVLNREKSVDESLLKATVERETEKLKASAEAAAAATTTTPERQYKKDAPTEDDDIRSVAESVILDDDGIKSVHSQKSMRSVVSRVKRQLLVDDDDGKEALPRVVEEEAVPPPVIQIHREDDGARLENTKSLNKLPFKNRNPAL